MIFQIFNFLFFLLYCYEIVFFIWILSSWLPINRNIFPIRFAEALVSPIYRRILSILPPLRLGMFDFSPFYMIFFFGGMRLALRYLAVLVLSL